MSSGPTVRFCKAACLGFENLKHASRNPGLQKLLYAPLQVRCLQGFLLSIAPVKPVSQDKLVTKPDSPTSGAAVEPKYALLRNKPQPPTPRTLIPDNKKKNSNNTNSRYMVCIQK